MIVCFLWKLEILWSGEAYYSFVTLDRGKDDNFSQYVIQDRYKRERTIKTFEKKNKTIKVKKQLMIDIKDEEDS